MKKIKSEQLYRIIIFSFLILLAMLYSQIYNLIKDSLNLRFVRGIQYDETFPTFLTAIAFAVLIHIYSKIKNHPTIYKLVYWVFVCFILFFFILWGHHQYVIKLGVLEAWFYHAILCIVCMVWNVTYAVFLYYIEE
ncbi:MAG TPA: hypothetical protein GXX18_14945 [Bacillales bacterium]|nr:hypothetical protein [Bacillales bacterium]